ncbi:MAG: LytR C-terminal domain-containing protein [Patescibacteria group bacterium]|nr:LytR C-terminal domain-containing protein [Patescibacteria group bacterium]
MPKYLHLRLSARNGKKNQTFGARRWIVGLVCFFGLVLVVPVALALSLGGIGIRMKHQSASGWFIYELPAGASTTDTVVVQNSTDQEQALMLNSVDYQPTDTGAFGLKGSGAQQNDIGKWVQLSTTTFSLAPGEMREITFILAIPPDADVGEHAGAITVQATALRGSPSGQSGAFIATRVGQRIYNTVPGKLTRQARLVGFTVRDDPKLAYYEFTVVAVNEGNVTITPELKLHLDGWGLVKVPPVGDPDRVDFPGFSFFELQKFYPKVVPTKWQLPRGTKESLKEVETYLRWRRPYVGRFTAYVTLDYEGTDGPQSIKSEPLHFTVLPWPETGYVLGVVVLLLVLMISWFIWRKLHHSGRGWQKYRVKAGDTLPLIAARCGVSWKRLAKVNRLKKPYAINTDDMLKVPPGSKNELTRGEDKGAADPRTGKLDGDKNVSREILPVIPRWRRFFPLSGIIVVSVVAITIAVLLLVRSMHPALQPTPTPTPAIPAPSASPTASAAPAASPVPVATTTPTVVAPAKDTIAIAVLNGSGIAGLAGKVVEELQQAGYHKLTAGNADAFDYADMTIRYRSSMRGAAEDITTVLRSRYQKFTLEEVATSTPGVDVTVILGRSTTTPPSP